MKLSLEFDSEYGNVLKEILEEKASPSMPMSVATAIMSGGGAKEAGKWQKQQFVAKQLLQLFPTNPEPKE